jgi:uncharacterized membrane protein
MGLASILSGQASLGPLIHNVGIQPADFEPLALVAWQWLVLSAIAAWIGGLAAGNRLLKAFRGQQPSEIAAVLHIAVQRQRRQNWLWLSIILTGTLALFWLRMPQALPHQQLNQPPNWPALEAFVFTTPEGWLWLARGGLALLAFGLIAAVSISAFRRVRRERAPDLLARSLSIRRRWRRGPQNAAFHSDSRSQVDSPDAFASTSMHALEQRFQVERRQMQIGLLIVTALLWTFLLPLIDGVNGQLPITGLALNGLALLALAVWLGGVLYLTSVLAPASHIIESAERTQTLVQAFSASRPAFAPAGIALALYSVFSLETHLTSFASLPALLSTPSGWFFSAALGLLGAILLLTLYQARRALPTLAQAAWLAARGTVMSVLGGMDVSRSLQVSQRERQTIANRAERRLRSIAHAQVILGILILLCLVLASVFGGPSAI